MIIFSSVTLQKGFAKRSSAVYVVELMLMKLGSLASRYLGDKEIYIVM